jgi:hypothetical protein
MPRPSHNSLEEYFEKSNFVNEHQINFLKHVIENTEIATKDELIELFALSLQSICQSSAGFEGGEKNTTPFQIKKVAHLAFTTGVNPEIFLIDKIDEERAVEEWVKEEGEKKCHMQPYFTHEKWEQIQKYWHPDPLIDLKTFSHDPLNNDKLINGYQELTKYFEEADASIEVNEPLLKGNNEDPGKIEAYREAQGQIYEAIEQALIRNCQASDEIPAKNPGFKYIRHFSLSKSTTIFPKDRRDEKFRAMMGEADSQALAHIIWCLKYFPNNCKFYVTKASRLRQHCFIDTKYLLTEDYILENNIIIPDCVFVDNVKHASKISEFKDRTVKNFKAESGKLIDDEDDILEQIRQTVEYTARQVQKRKRAIKLIEATFPATIKEDDHMKELIKREKGLLDRLKLVKNAIQNRELEVKNILKQKEATHKLRLG